MKKAGIESGLPSATLRNVHPLCTITKNPGIRAARTRDARRGVVERPRRAAGARAPRSHVGLYRVSGRRSPYAGFRRHSLTVPSDTAGHGSWTTVYLLLLTVLYTQHGHAGRSATPDADLTRQPSRHTRRARSPVSVERAVSHCRTRDTSLLYRSYTPVLYGAVYTAVAIIAYIRPRSNTVQLQAARYLHSTVLLHPS